MGMKCANCGKGVMYGHNVSHAKNRTRKIFKPNLHVARIFINGNRKKMRLCTTCLRMFKTLPAGRQGVERETRKASLPVAPVAAITSK